MVFKGGLSVYTTLNPSMQLAAEQSLRDGLQDPGEPERQARPGEHPEGAIVTIEPQTGYVRALVGGYDFFRSEFNRAVQAKRQPGSAFKPFVYVAALEAGFTPATRVDDAPVSYAVGPNGKAWKPENYDRKFRGLTTLQQGIEDSVNVVTVKLQERVGVNRTVRVARRFGHPEPALAQPVPGPRDVGPLPARADVGVRRPGQPGGLGRPHRHSLRDRRQRQAAGGERAAGTRGGVARDRVRGHAHAARRGRAGHRAGREVARDGRSPPRPEPPTTTRTPGSSGTRRAWSPGSGSATTGRAVSGVTRRGAAWPRRSGGRTWRGCSATAPGRTSRSPSASSSSPWTWTRPTSASASSPWPSCGAPSPRRRAARAVR